MKANETIGTFAYDGLIIDGKHSLDVKSITITVEKDKTFARGTLIVCGPTPKAASRCSACISRPANS